MSEQEIETGATGEPIETSVSEPTQAEMTDKTFSQDDVDKIVRERLDRERKRLDKKYGDVDIDRYRQLTEKEEADRLEQQKQRGEFESILKETVAKKDSQYQELQRQLTEIKVDGSLLSAASGNRAINAQQVSALLRNQVRLGETGEAEVTDNNGNVRYTDDGMPMTVDDLVGSFLKENPHFVSSGPAGSGTGNATLESGSRKGMGNIDPTQLNMNNPEDRKIYREYMKTKGIKI